MKQTGKLVFTGLTALSLLGTLLTPLAANAQQDRNDSQYNQSDQDRRDRANADRNRRDDNYARDHRDDSSNRDRRDDNYNRDHRDDNYNRDRRDNAYSHDSARYHRTGGSYQDYQHDRRQQTKNEWRNIAIGAGAVGVIGLLKHDNFLTFGGAAGALYSLNRFENDQRSQNRTDRLRAEYFNRPYFYRDGVRYDRRTVDRDGHRYYQFYRH